mgnify:CR=1 FL=1
MGRINSKNKGNKNERDLAKSMKAWTGFDFERVPSSGGLRWKRTTDTVGDITCTDNRHKGAFPFCIETKFHSDINFQHLLLDVSKVKILEFWDQAKSDAKRSGKIPLLFMRYNRMPKYVWFFVLSLDFYLRIKKHLPINHEKLSYRNKTDKIIILNSGSIFNSEYKQILKTIRNGKVKKS